jgi:hypothetical protein
MTSPVTPKAAPETSSSPTPPPAYSAGPPVEEPTTKIAEPAPAPEPEPEPEESPSVTPTSGATKDWPSYLRDVETKRPMIHAVLAPAKVERFDGEEVSLILGHKNGSWLDEDIKNSLFEFFGRRPKLRVEVDATVATDAPAAKPAFDPNRKEKTKKEILDHPLVKEAGEILNGEFVDFIPER